MKYKVRDQFTIKQGREFFTGGDVLELSDDEARSLDEKASPAAAAPPPVDEAPGGHT